MSRGKDVNVKELTPAEYEAKFGRKKPGPKAGATHTRAAKSVPGAALKKDGTPRKKPGRKPGSVVAKATAAPVVKKASSAAPWGYKKDGTPRKPPGRKSSTKSGAPKQEAASEATPKRRGRKPGVARKEVNEVNHEVSAKTAETVKSQISTGKVFPLVKALVEDFNESLLTDLHETIESKLVDEEAFDFDKNDWDAVSELMTSGFSKLSAVKQVRVDRVAEKAAEAALQAVSDEDVEPEDEDVEDDEPHVVASSSTSEEAAQLAHPNSP